MLRSALLLLLLVGCTSPQPTVLPVPVLCQVPAGLLEHDLEPNRPQGEYTQRDVAEYVWLLHRWGWRGWARIDAIDNWVAQHCE